MTDRIGAQPDRLDAYSSRTRSTIAPALDAAADYSTAFTAYQYAPDNDLGGVCLMDLRPQVETTLSDLATLDELPSAFARALRALDDRIGPMVRLEADAGDAFDAAVDTALLDANATAADLRDAADAGSDGDTPVWKMVWNAYSHPTGSYGSTVNLVNLGRWGRATDRLAQVQARLATHHKDLYWTGLNRQGRRQMARNIVRSARSQLPAARSAALASEEALLAGRGPLASYGSRISTRFPTVARMAPAARKGLGAFGVLVSIGDTVDAVGDREYLDAGFSAAGAVGGALLLMTGPVAVGVGSALVIGSVAYEYHDEIADAGRWVGDTLADGAGWVASEAGDKVRGVASFFGIGD